MKKYINLIIADEDKDLATSLAKYYWKTPFVKAVNAVTDHDGLIKQIKYELPDVILLDLHLPGAKGLELCKQLKATYPTLCIGFLCAKDEKNLVANAKESGASACFLKTVDLEIVTRFLLDYKNEKLKGFVEMMNIDNEMSVSVVVQDNLKLYKALPTREQEVLQMIVKKVPSTKIMQAFKITRADYEAHRTNLLAKLNLKSTADLAGFVIQD
jgi:DNA-binding NarL/FixJ family response regulator